MTSLAYFEKVKFSNKAYKEEEHTILNDIYAQSALG